MVKNYFYNTLKAITFAGLQLARAPINRKGVLFINRMSILNTSMMLVFSFIMPFFEEYRMLLFTLPFTLLFALPPLFNYKGYFSFCRYYFSLLPLLFLISVCVQNGAVLGDKYLILTTATIPLVLFKDKIKIYLIFTLNIVVFLFVIWYQSEFEPMIVMPEFIQRIYFIL